MSDVALRVRQLAVARGGATIIEGIDLDVNAGEITVLLGANGVGKTTLLESISGVIPAASGTVQLDGQDVLRLRRPRRARLGIAHVEQGRAVFPGLTVQENLLTAARSHDLAACLDVFPRLATMLDRRAELLSGGEQQMLVIGRALASRPKVLLLDEMSLGLAPVIVQQLLAVIRRLADDGLAILLVEQFANLALRIGDRVAVVAGGTVAYSGDCATLIGDPQLLHELYLGTRRQPAAS